MNKLFLRSSCLFIFLCITSNASSDEIDYLLVKTVDKDNKPIKAEIVKWWRPDAPEKKQTLICKRGVCSEWEIRSKLTPPVIIYAFASKVKENDLNCWDWFEGEAENRVGQKEIAVTLLYTATVCK